MTLVCSSSPAVIPYSSVSSDESSSLPTLHPSLVSSLSPWPSSRLSPLYPSLLTCESWPYCPRSSPPSSSPMRSSSSPLSLPCQAAIPELPHPVLPLLLLSLLPPAGPCIRSPRLPLLLLPSAPATNIPHRKKDVGNRMGGVVARKLVAGRSAPRGKIPSRPGVVVGDRKSRPLF